MNKDIVDIRKDSEKKVKELGYIINENLPLLEIEKFNIRAIDSIISRILILHGLAAVSYGFNQEIVNSWLENEDLISNMYESELKLINAKKKDQEDIILFRTQVEASYALCWSVGFVKELNFSQGCPDNFVSILPDLKKKESSNVFRKKAKMLNKNDIIKSLDLAYCLHWAIVELASKGKNNTKLSSFIIVERRRALEWVLQSNLDWYDINLDT